MKKKSDTNKNKVIKMFLSFSVLIIALILLGIIFDLNESVCGAIGGLAGAFFYVIYKAFNGD